MHLIRVCMAIVQIMLCRSHVLVTSDGRVLDVVKVTLIITLPNNKNTAFQIYPNVHRIRVIFGILNVYYQVVYKMLPLSQRAL